MTDIDLTERAETIRSIVAKYGRLSVDVIDLTDDASLYEAGMTSHASVNVMMAIEDHYEFEFPERLIDRSTFETLGTLRAALDDALT